MVKSITSNGVMYVAISPILRDNRRMPFTLPQDLGFSLLYENRHSGCFRNITVMKPSMTKYHDTVHIVSKMDQLYIVVLRSVAQV